MGLYLSRKNVITNEWRVDLSEAAGANSQVMTIAIGPYYNDSSTASESLRSQIDTRFDAHTTLPDFTITYSTTTGKFTISTAATIFELHWNTGTYGTSFRDWLGFTADKTGATSYTSDNPAQGAISTSSSRAHFTGVQRDTSGATMVTEAGVVARVGSGNTRVVVRWEHPFERITYQASPWESGMFDDGGTVVPWTFQDWWGHHAQTGQPWRYYTALGLAIDNYYGELAQHEDVVNEFHPKRVIENADTYWAFGIAGRLWVTP